jgi:thiamine pyrophosphate-dependent acetolactate synthase large subunit-like protein
MKRGTCAWVYARTPVCDARPEANACRSNKTCATTTRHSRGWQAVPGHTVGISTRRLKARRLHSLIAIFCPRQHHFRPITLVASLGRRTKVNFGFVGDAKTTLRALLPKLQKNAAHSKESLDHYRKARKGLDELATANSGKKLIHPQYVARVLDQLAAEDAIFTCDVATQPSGPRYLTMNGKRRILGSFTDGSMANALPRAVGAQVSHPADK